MLLTTVKAGKSRFVTRKTDYLIFICRCNLYKMSNKMEHGYIDARGGKRTKKKFVGFLNENWF